MLVADLIAQALREEGTCFITGFPENRVLDSAAVCGVRPIITRTEKVAVSLADGYARSRFGQTAGVCAVQDGPGGEAAFGALAQAYGDRSPLLLICGSYDRPVAGLEPNFEPMRGLSMISRWSAAINSAELVRPRLHAAFSRLRSGDGPVVLTVGRDLLYEDVEDKFAPYAKSIALRAQADPADVTDLADALCRVRRPVILAGQGVLYAQATPELVALAEALKAPVMTTLNGKSAFPEDHDLALGTAARSIPAPVKRFLESTDFILGVGTSFTRSDYIVEMPVGVPLAQITRQPTDVGRFYAVGHGAIGDAKLVLAQLTAEISGRSRDTDTRADITDEIAAIRAEYLKEWRARLESADEPISPYRVVWELNRTLDKTRTVFTHDSGNPRDQATPFYQATVPGGYIGWGKTTHLGTGLPLALGAKLARPDWTSVNLMGDAALGMVAMDLETGVRERLPVLTVVMNNGVMGGYGAYMPNAARLHRSNHLSGDYRGVATSLGLHAETVRDPEALGPSLRRCLQETNGGRSALLEVITREEPKIPQ